MKSCKYKTVVLRNDALSFCVVRMMQGEYEVKCRLIRVNAGKTAALKGNMSLDKKMDA